MNSDTPSPAAHLASFSVGDWLVEPRACLASRETTTVKLRPQLIDLLLCLARKPGEIVLKDEILAEVWPGQYIAESGLSRCIAELRQLLQDDAQQPRYIETIPKRGYRLIAPVAMAHPAPLVPEAHPGSPAGEARETAAATPPPAEAPGIATTRRVGWRPSAHVAALLAVVATAVAVGLMTRSPAKVLTEQDAVLLAFENRTGDAVFDDTLPLAVSIQMEQSPYLGLLSPARVQETLRMMQRPADTPITRAVGMEVCERVGGQALIVTSIASLGHQYAIGLEAVACATGQSLARRQVTTDRKEGVLVALERAAVEIRGALGEPAVSLRQYNVPIIEATTSSLDALRALRRGDQAKEKDQRNVALAMYNEAVRLDPEFALAYSRVAAMTAAGILSETDSRQALERSYALRERVTLPERLEIEATYHRLVTRELTNVVAAYETLKRTYPRRAEYRRALANEHAQAGRYDQALDESLEAHRLEPNSVMNLVAVARAYLWRNRIAEARAAAERAVALSDVGVAPRIVLFHCGIETGDAALVARQRAWAAQHSDLALPTFAVYEAEVAMSRGRLQEALGYLQQFESWATAQGAVVIASMARLRMARWEVLAGQRAEGLRRLEQERRRGLAPEAKTDAVKVLMSAGEFERAAGLLDEIERERGPARPEPDDTFIKAYRASIDVARGRREAGFAAFAALAPLDLGYAYGYIPVFERGLAYERAGSWAMARAAFEKILANPTIDSGMKLLPLAELGVARTLGREGDAAGSRRFYEKFFERWRSAEQDLPVLLQARREYAALPHTPR
jgi:eukaryotic-like serine/threonine-protein kinase